MPNPAQRPTPNHAQCPTLPPVTSSKTLAIPGFEQNLDLNFVLTKFWDFSHFNTLDKDHQFL